MGFNKERRGPRGRRGRDDSGGFGDFEPQPFGGDTAGQPQRTFGGDRNRGGASDSRGSGMPPQIVGEGQGVVKFFNSSKGFGFIEREDGGEDVFVHISAVEEAGLQSLANNQPLEFTLVERNGKVSATSLKIEGEPLPIEDSGGSGRSDRSSRGPRGGGDGGASRGARGRRQLTGERTTGSVKFFNDAKGFGFISRDDGQADAFVHISALQRAGMQGLVEGQRLAFDIEVDDRGKFAAVNLAAEG